MGQVLLPKMFTVAPAQFHLTIVNDYLERKSDRFNYIAPRGFAKSSICAGLLVLHHIFFGDYDQKFVVLVSKTEGHAVKLLDTLKNILSGQDGDGSFAQFFGVNNKHNARKWGEKVIELHDRTMIIARGTGQQVIGLKKDSQRPTLIVFDDPEDLSNTKTAESMNDNFRWMLNGIVPSKDPNGLIIIIGTPQHELCMVETLMKMKGWISRRWQALKGTGWEEDYSLATSLWPERHSVKSLIMEYESASSIGRSSSFYSEYQCVVVGDGDRKFTSNMIMYYKILKIENVYGYRVLHGQYYAFDSELKEFVPGQKFKEVITIQVGLDLASTITSRSDYSVLFFWGITRTRKFFILKMVRFRKTPLPAANLIKEELKKMDPDYVYIEQQGFQVMVRDTLRDLMDVNYPGMGTKITYQDEKEDRIYTKLNPHYASKNVFHPVGEDTNLKQELFMFPRGATDDIIDAASTGLFRIHYPDISDIDEYLQQLAVKKLDETYYNKTSPSWTTV